MSESYYSAASRLIQEAGASPGPRGMFILAAAQSVLALADGLTALGKAAVLLIEPANAPGHQENLAALADSCAGVPVLVRELEALREARCTEGRGSDE